MAANAAQAARYLALLERVEAGCDFPLTLGGLKQEALAADLDEVDRTDLIGRCDTYIADTLGANDPVERGARGDGPWVPGPTGDDFGSALDDPEDGAADVEDGLVPAQVAEAWEREFPQPSPTELAEAVGHPFGKSKYEYASADERAEFLRRFPSMKSSRPGGGELAMKVSLFKDPNGFFVCTHRARSKSYRTVGQIPKSAVDFIESTG